jgi:hypothetical protein
MKTRASLLLAVLINATLLASGEPLYQWTQTGYVQFVVGPAWDGSVAPGSPFTTTMLLRTSSSQSYPPDTAEAQYRDVLVSASMSFGNYTFMFNQIIPGFEPTIKVLNNYNLGGPTDGYGWYWESPDTQYGIETPFLQGFLLSTDLSLLGSPEFNLQEFPTSRFDRQTSGQLDGLDLQGHYRGIVYQVTGHSITPVPEPGPGILCLGMLVAAAVLRRQRV